MWGFDFFLFAKRERINIPISNQNKEMHIKREKENWPYLKREETAVGLPS